jgi:two-component system phosphate regulon response regulator PhoB
MAHILIVEDEKDISVLLEFNLTREGYRVSVAWTGEDGLKAARTLQPDLVILDLMLPGIGGMDVCRQLKSNPLTSAIRIIMLTARDSEVDVVAGLESGADDYITKPFSPRVVIARARAALRRREGGAVEGGEILTLGALSIDTGRHQVMVAGSPIQLTLTEFQLLAIMARKPGWVFSRYQLVDALRGEDYIVTDRAIDVQIANLRKKLGPSGDYVETVRGVGYRVKESE